MPVAQNSASPAASAGENQDRPIEATYEDLAGLLSGSGRWLPADEAEWTRLVTLAGQEFVGPRLAHVLRARSELPVPDSARQLMDSMYRDAFLASLRHQAVRQRSCRTLCEAGIPVLLLKGAALAPEFYKNAATRVMGDQDLLVPAARVREAARRLAASGFRFRSGSLATELRSSRGHVICIDSVTNGIVELHWEIIGLGPRHAAAAAEIWEEALPAGFEPGALVMRPAHLVVHLCAHLTLQHKRAWLQALYDLHLVLSAISAAEAAVVTQAASRWGLVSCVGRTLQRVQQLFGSPLAGPLAAWVEEAAARQDLQAHVAAVALAPGAPNMPHRGILGLAMGEQEQTLLQFLFPSVSRAREWMGLAPHEPLSPGAYARLMAQRLRHSPAHVRQLWHFWWAVRQNRPSPSPMPRHGTDSASPPR